MSLLATIRRIHGPLIGIAIACVFSVGCRSAWRDYEVSLGKPEVVYEVGDGTLLFGYDVVNEHRPDYSGWHWLEVGPETAEALWQPADAQGPDDFPALVAVTYTGGSANARLFPPLLDPGYSDSNPPVLGGQEVRPVLFSYDTQWQAPRLIGPDGQTLPLLIVSPAFMVDEVERESRMTGIGRFLRDTLVIAGVVVLAAAVLYLDSQDDDDDDWP